MNSAAPPFDLLTAAVLHEVKNHLTELQWRLSSHAGLSAEQAVITRCSQQLTALLLSQREQAGQLQAAIDAGNPVDLVADLVAEYAALFPTKELDFEHDDAPAIAFYDAFLLRLALANALHNACRHARQRVCISVKTIADASTGDSVCFEIADDGPGFPAALLTQSGLGSGPVPVSHSGTGLGLYLAARIARLHRVDSRCGWVECGNRDGAVFRLCLP